MKLVVPTTFEPELLEGLGEYPVGWLYGSLPGDPAGRAKQWLPAADAGQVETHIADAAERGMRFLYTMNATCNGNREFSADGQRTLIERLGWLADAGAAGVVATSPYIVETIRQRYPELTVCVSTLANVDNVDKALFYEDLGVNAIYVPEYMNRDFRMLRAMRRRIKCDLVLTVNLGCLVRCPLRDYHASYISHASESLDQGCYVDFSLSRCTQIKSASPVEIMKAPWIRPEDLARYEALGYDHFKLAGRENGRAWILRAAAAYASRSYQGLLNDLVIGFEELAPFGQLPLQIDNTRLDGFLAGFERKDCRLGCHACTHCEDWTQRAVSAGEDLAEFDNRIKRFLRRFTTGTFRAPVVRA